MKIKIVKVQKQDKPFIVVTFEIEETGDLVNIKISHTAWRQKTNRGTLDGITDYIKKNGRNFIQRKISSGELQFTDKGSDVPNYVVATPEYNHQTNEILINFVDLEKA